MWLVGLAVLAIIGAVVIKWQMFLWATATIAGVIGAVTKQVGILAVAIFFLVLAIISVAIYGFNLDL